VSGQRIRPRFLPLIAIVALASVAAIGLTGPPSVSGQAPTTRSVALDADWNLVAWTGPTSAVEEALAGIVSRVRSAHTFDNGRKQFDNFSPTSPAFVNSLKEFGPGVPVWIRMSQAATWEQPVGGGGGATALSPGFNLVAWLGTDGAPVDDAVGSIGSALLGVFAFDPSDQGFDTYGPNNPSILNSLKLLPFGAGLWVRVSAAASWTHPGASGPSAPLPPAAPSAATRLTFPDLNLVIDLPEGALPAGVSADDIVASEAKVSDTTYTLGGDPVDLDGWAVLGAVTVGPGTLTFLKPVTISLTVPRNTGGSAFALPLTSANLDRPVQDVRTEIRAAGDSALVIWDTTQVGTFAAVESSIEFAAADVGTVVVGAPFTVPVSVNIAGGIPGITVGGVARVPLSLSAGSLTGTFSAPAGVSPASATAPGPTAVAFDPASSTTYSADFTCTAPGAFEIVYGFTLDWALQVVLPAPLLPLPLLDGVYQGSITLAGSCEATP